MSPELWFALALGVVLLLMVTGGGWLWILAEKAEERSDDRFRQTEEKLQTLSRRVAHLETLERQSSVPAPAGSREEGGVDSRTRDATLRGASVREAAGPPARPAPPTLDEIHDEAAEALASASMFAAFAKKHRAQGFTLDPGGPPPTPWSGSADRADICLLQADGLRLVLPGFNLRRGQGLLTSDAGRAAEARLGWLFNIEAGPELRAIEGASVAPDGWTVRRKGRLSIPL